MLDAEPRKTFDVWSGHPDTRTGPLVEQSWPTARLVSPVQDGRWHSEGRFEIAAAVAVRPLVPARLPERCGVGNVVAPCLECLPGDAPVGVVAAGVQDGARVHGERIAMPGQGGVFGEEERGEEAGR
ncbi:hypothetical protein [Streptomyces sp. NPDC056600]|uniref:hypothetical protein n=1 Tax=Streptomyces sp. NPDC056600 TaxID=3345874 RepID=UPI0036BA85E2